MSERNRTLTLGTLLFGIILIVAIGSRALALSGSPLSDGEATHALAAFEAVHSDDSEISGNGQHASNAAYHVSTAGLFSLLPVTNASARIVSALAGIGLIVVLVMLRERIEDAVILLLAALFTISPVLLTIGRTAGGAGIAILGIIGTLVILLGEENESPRRSRLRWAAALLGLSLAAGSAAIYGMIGLAIGFLFSRLDPVTKSSHRYTNVLRSFARELWITLLTAVLVASSLGVFPSGIDALAGAVTEWLQAWGAPAGFSVASMLTLLVLYEPFVLTFGIIGAVISFRNKEPFGRAATWWSLGSMAYALIYPGRNPALLAWVIIPLTFLAVKALLTLTDQIARRRSWPEWIALTAVLIIMTTVAYFFMLNFTLGLGPSFAVLDPIYSIGFAIGIAFFTALIILMFGLGWSWDLVWQAGGAAAVFLLLTLTISSAWRLNYSSETIRAQMLWDTSTPAPGLSKIIDTLELVAQKDRGFSDRLVVYRETRLPPLLAWAIRDYEQVDRTLTGTDKVPVMLFSSQSTGPASTSGYIGQSLAIRQHPGWSGFLPPDSLRWWFARDAEVEYEPWVVMIRSDLVSLTESASGGVP